MGCDVEGVVNGHIIRISIHAPRVGCDYIDLDLLDANEAFQSTHPVWGAT